MRCFTCLCLACKRAKPASDIESMLCVATILEVISAHLSNAGSNNAQNMNIMLHIMLHIMRFSSRMSSSSYAQSYPRHASHLLHYLRNSNSPCQLLVQSHACFFLMPKQWTTITPSVSDYHSSGQQSPPLYQTITAVL